MAITGPDAKWLVSRMLVNAGTAVVSAALAAGGGVWLLAGTLSGSGARSSAT